MQQWSLLREAGIRSPDPIKCFYQDLTKELEKWTTAGHEIILMIDANEHMGEKAGGTGSLVSKFQLMDLIALRHPEQQIPNTYARGPRRIDFIFGTPRVQQHCCKAGILPFGTGYVSDHRASFIRIHIKQILQTTVSASESTYARKLQNAAPKERQRFLEETFNHYSKQNLFERFQKLKETVKWQREHFDEYERCDEQHIAGMLAAKKKTKKIKTTPWSPIFGAAVARKAFWKIGLTLKLTHKRPSDEYIWWAETLDPLGSYRIYVLGMYYIVSMRLMVVEVGCHAL
jgi:hypothetical protein